MKDSPVIDLQALASDPSSDIFAVLMKAKMIAFKLDLTDITEWIELELKGYPTIASAPDYRRTQGIMKAWNPFNGWIPVDFGDDIELSRAFTTITFTESVSSLKRALDPNPKTLQMPVPYEMVAMLNPGRSGTDMRWTFSAGAVEHIFSTIRNKILEWALALEKNGVFGEGLIFNQHEKAEAANVTVTNNNTINNHGNGVTMIGDMENTNSVVGGTVSHVQQQNIKGDFSALERMLKEHGVDDSDINELKGVIEQTPKPETKEEVEKGFGAWIGKMTGKAFTGAIKIAGAAAPAILTNAICQYFGIAV